MNANKNIKKMLHSFNNIECMIFYSCHIFHYLRVDVYNIFLWKQ